MDTCAIPLCIAPIDGMALICDEHRAGRVKECAGIRARPNFNPSNRNCNYGYHQGREQFGRANGDIDRDGKLVVDFLACTECHYCGQVHPVAA